MFEVGQKVLCVDDSPGSSGEPSRLVVGKIYTIACPPHADSAGQIGIRVAELQYPIMLDGFRQTGHLVKRFRSLDEIEGGMQMLRLILKQPKQHIKERA